jgi:hypothetical protein
MIKVTTKTKNLVVLTPKMFNKMLCLPSANKTLHLADANNFLASQAGGSNVLKDFSATFCKHPDRPFNN